MLFGGMTQRFRPDRANGFSVDALAAGAESLGTSYRSPWTFTSRIARGRHDGATSMRDLTFVSGCTCFEYIGTTFAVK